MISTTLRTTRLTLIPATAAHVRAELAGDGGFGAMIGAEVPASWPPGEYDVDAQLYFLERLSEAGDAGVGWYGWYAVQAANGGAPATLVGAGGYFGPPADDGVVEIGYSMCDEWRGLGYATELAGALAAHAAAQPGVTRVIAHTTAANPASVKVLERCGFVCTGPGEQPGSLRFEYARSRASV